MTSVNKVIIVGRLGHDPEVRQFQNGGSVTNINVATSERWTDKNTGERKEQTEWHRIALFNRLGEIAAQYLRKGSLVYIEGSLNTRKWQDQNGQDRYSTEIRANNMTMLDSRNDNQSAGGQNYQAGNFNQGFNQPPQYNQNHYGQSGFGQNPAWGGNPNGMNGQAQYPQQGFQGGFDVPPQVQAQGFSTPPVSPTPSADVSGNAFLNTPPTPAPTPKAITPPSNVGDDDIPF